MNTIVIVFTVIAIIIVVYFFVRNKDDSDNYSKYLKEATELKKEGDLDGAIKISIESSNSSVYKKAQNQKRCTSCFVRYLTFNPS
jgi:uncharacterized protein YxeA